MLITEAQRELAEGRLQAIGDEYAILFARMEELTFQRERIQNSLSFIYYIPNELLLQILKFATHNESTSTDRCALPLVFCRVSRRWRDLTLSNPQLWTHFDFCLMSKAPTTPDILQKRDELAKAMPLDVTIAGSCSNAVEWLTVIHPRIETLDIDVSCRTTISRYITTSMPTTSLRHLRMKSGSCCGTASAVTSPDCTHLTTLQTLYLDNTPMPWVSLLVTELTKFEIVQSTIPFSNFKDIWDLIGRNPRLETLKLGRSTFQDHDERETLTGAEGDPAERWMTLPNLKNLTLENFNTFAVQQMLRAFEGPELTTLQLDVKTEATDGTATVVDWPEYFVRFPKLSSFTIRSSDQIGETPQIQEIQAAVVVPVVIVPADVVPTDAVPATDALPTDVVPVDVVPVDVVPADVTLLPAVLADDDIQPVVGVVLPPTDPVVDTIVAPPMTAV